MLSCLVSVMPRRVPSILFLGRFLSWRDAECLQRLFCWLFWDDYVTFVLDSLCIICICWPFLSFFNWNPQCVICNLSGRPYVSRNLYISSNTLLCVYKVFSIIPLDFGNISLVSKLANLDLFSVLVCVRVC